MRLRLKSLGSYHEKIKIFIRLLAFLTQAFLFITITASYINLKANTHSDVTESRFRYASTEIDNLYMKIDNALYHFSSSGAIELCSMTRIFDSKATVDLQYKQIKDSLLSNPLSNRYFSDYYLIGWNVNQFSFSYINGSFSQLGDLKLEYSNLINNYRYTEFSENLSKPFVFNSKDFRDINVSKQMQKDYDEMLSFLDGKIVYYTIYKDVMCVLVINGAYFDEVLGSGMPAGSSVVLKNASGDVIYSAGRRKHFIAAQKPFEYSNELCSLTLVSGTVFNSSDLLFVLGTFLCCLMFLLWAFYISKVYSFRIMEPYKIIKTFFNLNNQENTVEEFDYLEFPSVKRSDTNKNVFEAFIFAILLPTLLSSAIMLSILGISSARFMRSKTHSAHLQLQAQLYDSFDFYINALNPYINKDSATYVPSRLRYDATLDSNFYVEGQIFPSVTSAAETHFSRAVRSACKDLGTGGMLINIEYDLFGDKALGYIKKQENGGYVLSVIKYSEIGSVITDNETDYMVTDSFGNIILQSTYVPGTEKSRLLSNTSREISYRSEFPEFGWQLCTFNRNVGSGSRIYPTVVTDIIIIIIFLLAILIVAWKYSTAFIRPLDRIKEAMHNQNSEIETNKAAPPDNEIEEIFTVYNNMVRHINKITDDKIELLQAEEKINTSKIRAELNALQHQINPHFLYNTLEMINMNVLRHGDFTTSKLIGKLSKLFRYAVGEGSQSVLLSHEIENTKNYISIWSLRFPGRYEFSFNAVGDISSAYSLRLIVQPIVENCFIHAFDNMLSNCKISITTSIKNNIVTIKVCDNGCGMTAEELSAVRRSFEEEAGVSESSIGVSNVYKRLKLFYSDAATLNIESKSGSGTTVTVIFPSLPPE